MYVSKPTNNQLPLTVASLLQTRNADGTRKWFTSRDVMRVTSATMGEARSILFRFIAQHQVEKFTTRANKILYRWIN